jgi:hypothetical protein
MLKEANVKELFRVLSFLSQKIFLKDLRYGCMGTNFILPFMTAIMWAYILLILLAQSSTSRIR